MPLSSNKPPSAAIHNLPYCCLVDFIWLDNKKPAHAGFIDAIDTGDFCWRLLLVTSGSVTT